MRLKAGARDFLADKEAVIVVAHDNRCGKVLAEAGPLQCGPKKAGALPVKKTDELLGIHRPRERP